MAREKGVVEPKPMMRVLGVPLVERNLIALLRDGFDDLAIAVEMGSVTAHWAKTRGAAIAASWGARCAVIEERRRLGTMGAATMVTADVLVVVYADNLTNLNLATVLLDHLHHEPAMTVCTHLEPVRIPYGVMTVKAQELVEYCEKPEPPIRIASGIYVLGREALSQLSAGSKASAPDVVTGCLARGATVRAFSHDSKWIDVNDSSALRRAEALILENSDFDVWAATPAVEVVGAVLSRPPDVLLEWRPCTRDCYAGLWDTPGGRIHGGEAPAHALGRELYEELGVRELPFRTIATFDDRDLFSRRIFRHHVFEAPLEQLPEAREGQRLQWVNRDALAEIPFVSPIALRSVAAVEALDRGSREVE